MCTKEKRQMRLARAQASRTRTRRATSWKGTRQRATRHILIYYYCEILRTVKMAKRATKQSKAAKSANPPKRAPTEELQSSANSKRPRRLASTKSTPTKSRYFEGDSDSEDKESIESSDHGDGSGYEETDEDVAPTSESEGDGGSDISGEDDNYGRAKGSRTFGSVSRTKSQKMKDKADFEPGVQVIIKKPKAKGPGSTPYQDDSVHPNTMQFLRDLKSNNNRQWLKRE